MTIDELRQIYNKVGERSGWDFSRMRDDRDPIPWNYGELIKDYLKPTDLVLDIGTGGGERFIKWAPYFGKGIGIDNDPEMIKTANENLPQSLRDKVSFQVMSSNKLEFSDDTFDVVLDRHAPFKAEEVIRVLKPNGYFITQQVGSKNMQNIVDEFNWATSSTWSGPTKPSITIFRSRGCMVIVYQEYNVNYYVKDIESFIFWLKSIPLPGRLDIEKHWQVINRIISKYTTPKGIMTNEHRELLIIQNT